jgi:hypothetical protein
VDALQEIDALPIPKEVVVATPPVGNNATDMVSPDTTTIPSNKSQRKTRKRGMLSPFCG